jgi:hypothetical protein
MPIKRQLFRAIRGEGKLLADYRYHPLLVYRWFGLVTPPLFDALYWMRDNYALDGSVQSQVWVHDITEIQPLTATSRKYLADLQANDPKLAEYAHHLTIPILDNPLIRGVMTAVVWMAGKDKFPMEFERSIQSGINHSFKIFETWGASRPTIPPNYEFPKENEAAFVDLPENTPSRISPAG